MLSFRQISTVFVLISLTIQIGCTQNKTLRVTGLAIERTKSDSSWVNGSISSIAIEDDSIHKLEDVKIEIIDPKTDQVLRETRTGIDGGFDIEFTFKSGSDLRIKYSKFGYEPCQADFTWGFMSHFINSTGNMHRIVPNP